MILGINPFALRKVKTVYSFGFSGCSRVKEAFRESVATFRYLCHWHTLKCLSIGRPKLINYSFVSNGKVMVFRCPNTQGHYNEAVIYLNFGTPKNNEFSIWNKWKIYYF